MELKDIDSSQFVFDFKDDKFVQKLRAHKQFLLPPKLSYTSKDQTITFDYDYKQLFTYISLMYEIKSPLHVEVPAYPHRKTKAAQLAGYKFNKYDEFEPEVEAILIGDVEAVNIAIVHYVTMQRVADYLMYTSFQGLLQREHISAASGKAQKDSIKNIKDLTAETERLSQKLFGGEESRKLRDTLYGAAEFERLKLRSEDIAKIVEETGDVPEDFNPYGDYKPSKIKYAGEVIPKDDTSIPASRQARSRKQRSLSKKNSSKTS